MSILNAIYIALGTFLLTMGFLFVFVRTGKAIYRKEGEKRFVSKLPSNFNFIFNVITKSLFSKKLKTPVVLPKVEFILNNVDIDEDNVSKYRSVCGFSNEHQVPITYPYLIIFPLQSMLFIDNSFPFKAIGLVHLANKIQQFGVITFDSVKASVKFSDTVIPHEKGYCFVVISEVYSKKTNALLWRCESTYLFKTKRREVAGSDCDSVQLYESKIKESDTTDIPEGKLLWDLPENYSKKYAAVSGDYNPIHMYAFTAKLLGFPRGAIVHGMWSIAACAARIMPAITAAYTAKDGMPLAELYAELKLPLYQPSKPTLFSKSVVSVVNGHVFEVKVNKNGKNGDIVPHLRGTCSWVAPN